jgi:ABC-type bacteriocin/lantibiotic exporter with double-glycine peptidase domain
VNLLKLIRNYYKFIRIAIDANLAFSLLLLLNALSNFTVIFFELNAVKNVTKALVYKDYAIFYSGVLPFIIGAAIIKLLLSFISGSIHKNRQAFILSLEEHILRKTMAISYELLESPSFLALKQRVDFSIHNQGLFENLIECSIEFTQSLAIALSTFFIISSSSFILFVFLCTFVIITALIRYRLNKFEVAIFHSLGDINRNYWYFGSLKDYYHRILDIKANGFEKIIDEKFKNETNNINEIFKKYYSKKSKSLGLIAGLVSLQTLICTLWLGTKVIKGLIQISDFTYYFAAAMKFVSYLGQASESILDLQRFCIFLDPVLELLDFPEEVEGEGEVLSRIDNLVFDNVSFRYPESKEDVISNINFKFSSGNIISIVGENGAGKSTIVKLICQLFNPSSGKILYSGINKDRLSHYTINKHVSTIFQDFQLLGDSTVLENITADACLDSEDRKNVIDKIMRIMSYLDFDESVRLEDRLGVGFKEGNVELSSGQRQLVALLRALYRETSIIILDEPTSNVDIRKEKAIFESLSRFKEDRIIILISHRMSNVHYADQVIYIHDGEIHDVGSHDELFERCAGYRGLYTAQSVLYE